MKLKTLFFVLIALVIAVIAHDARELFAPTSIEGSQKQRETVDYYFNDFEMVAFQEQGNPQYSVQGQHLTHSQTTETSRITKPDINSFSADGAITEAHLSAQNAELNHQANILELRNKVILLNGSDTEQTLTLNTEFLHANLATKHITTNQKVLIHAPNGLLEGTGMDSYLDQESLRLHSDVQTIYQTQP